MKYVKNFRRALLLSSLSTSAFYMSGPAVSAEPGGMVESAQQKAYELTGKDVARSNLTKDLRNFLPVIKANSGRCIML